MKIRTSRMLIAAAALTLVVSGCSTASKNVAPAPAPAPKPAMAPAPAPKPAPKPAMAPAPQPKYVIEGVNFDLDKATLKPMARERLDGVASALMKQPNVKYEVSGYTDNSGSADYNMGLSDRRAKSVKDYLVNKGVSPSQLTAKGYGESQPLVSNSTREGRAKNRRVEIWPLK